jgi:uncharacterized protein (DUF305 family)
MKMSFQLAALLILMMSAVALFSWQEDPHSHNRGAGMNADWSELTGSMEKMHVAMGSIEHTGDSDVDFVRLMLPHHQGAIDMAKTQLMYGKDPQMRRLAQEIITDQQSEIELMQLWLKKHDPGAAHHMATGGVSREH